MNEDTANTLKMVTPNSLAVALLGGVPEETLGLHHEWVRTWFDPMMTRSCSAAVRLVPIPKDKRGANIRGYIEALVRCRDKFARRARKKLPPSWGGSPYEWRVAA
jgi:hypothetical protein